jgi:HEAT repeat protein
MADRFTDHRDRLATFAADLSEPDTLDQLLKTITESEFAIADQDLSELFGQLQPQAMETALSWLPRLKHEQARRLLKRATDHLAAAHPEAVNQALESEDRTVVVGALRLVSDLELESAGPKLKKFVTDPDKDVRLALVDAMASLATPSSLKQLERLLEDSDRDVRIRAVTELSIRHRRALSQVEAAVLGRGLRAADLGEKRAFFEAYGLLSGDGGVARLRSLLRRGWFKRKVDTETRACAAMALGKIANTDARDALEKAQGDKEPLVRVAVGEALEKTTS